MKTTPTIGKHQLMQPSPTEGSPDRWMLYNLADILGSSSIPRPTTTTTASEADTSTSHQWMTNFVLNMEDLPTDEWVDSYQFG